MKESQFQSLLIKRLKEIFPGCIILKNDPGYIQGFPDLTILYGKHWAVLECKSAKTSRHQPNQEYYISKANDMSFGSFIFPENEEDVLDDLRRVFGV
jgi:hypothetical protein